MSIEEFVESVREEVERQTGKEVRIHEVTKNNGVVLHGINIIEPGINITPTIYIEPFKEYFENGRRLEEIAEHICEICRRDKLSSSVSMEWFRDFEQVKDKVAYKLSKNIYDKPSLRLLTFSVPRDRISTWK